MNLFFKRYSWNSNRGLSLGLLFPVGSTCVSVTASTNDDMGVKFLNNNFYFFSLIAAYPLPAQLGFQEPVTPVMEGIIDFHHDLMFFLVFILGFVCWFLVNIGYSFFSRLPEGSNNHYFVPFVRVPSRKNHHLWLEIIWTIIPALILVSIVLPSFALIYSMDEFFLHPRITLKAVGNQWYWTYNYGCALEYNPKSIPTSDARISDLVNFLMGIRDNEAFDFFSENWANSYEDNDNADVIDGLKESAVETMVYYYLALDKEDIDDRIFTRNCDIRCELEYLLARAFCNYEHFAGAVVLNRLSPDLEVTVENIKKDLVERAVVEVIFPGITAIEEKISRGDISVESDLKQIVYDALLLYSDFSEIVNLKKEILSQDSVVRHHFALKFDSYMKTGELAASEVRLLEVDKRVLLPTSTGIRLLVSSYDVLHSWAVPSFGVKLDGCPGRLNQTFLYIKEEGLFYGQCSEICGVNHAFMPIAIRTISPDHFNFWLARRIEVFNNLIKESSLEKTETTQIKHVNQPTPPAESTPPPIDVSRIKPDILSDAQHIEDKCDRAEIASRVLLDEDFRPAAERAKVFDHMASLIECISEDHKRINMDCVKQIIKDVENCHILCISINSPLCADELIPFRAQISTALCDALKSRGQDHHACFTAAGSPEFHMYIFQRAMCLQSNQTTTSNGCPIEFSMDEHFKE